MDNCRPHRAEPIVRTSIAVLLLALIGVSTPAQGTSSLRCDSKVVSAGMLAAEVLAVCGEPDLRDVWAVPGAYGYGAPTEQWTYNFGASQLLRVLLIRNGRAEIIDSAGYGFPTPRDRRCSPNDIQPALSKYWLLTHCGEPLTRVADYVFYSEPRHPRPGLPKFHGAVSPVYREEWTYNFGSSNLLRLVTLENGLVVEVQLGNRGFDQP